MNQIFIDWTKLQQSFATKNFKLHDVTMRCWVNHVDQSAPIQVTNLPFLFYIKKAAYKYNDTEQKDKY